MSVDGRGGRGDDKKEKSRDPLCYEDDGYRYVYSETRSKTWLSCNVLAIDGKECCDIPMAVKNKEEMQAVSMEIFEPHQNREEMSARELRVTQQALVGLDFCRQMRPSREKIGGGLCVYGPLIPRSVRILRGMQAKKIFIKLFVNSWGQFFHVDGGRVYLRYWILSHARVTDRLGGFHAARRG